MLPCPQSAVITEKQRDEFLSKQTIAGKLIFLYGLFHKIALENPNTEAISVKFNFSHSQDNEVTLDPLFILLNAYTYLIPKKITLQIFQGNSDHDIRVRVKDIAGTGEPDENYLDNAKLLNACINPSGRDDENINADHFKLNRFLKRRFKIDTTIIPYESFTALDDELIYLTGRYDYRNKDTQTYINTIRALHNDLLKSINDLNDKKSIPNSLEIQIVKEITETLKNRRISNDLSMETMRLWKHLIDLDIELFYLRAIHHELENEVTDFSLACANSEKEFDKKDSENRKAAIKSQNDCNNLIIAVTSLREHLREDISKKISHNVYHVHEDETSKSPAVKIAKEAVIMLRSIRTEPNIEAISTFSKNCNKILPYSEVKKSFGEAIRKVSEAAMGFIFGVIFKALNYLVNDSKTTAAIKKDYGIVKNKATLFCESIAEPTEQQNNNAPILTS